jgi:hypothetical protein
VEFFLENILEALKYNVPEYVHLPHRLFRTKQDFDAEINPESELIRGTYSGRNVFVLEY